MKGLIWKDLLILRKSLRTYLLMVLIYAALSLTGTFGGAFVAMLCMMLLILPISAFAYDEMARWDRYAFSLPLGRERVVQARYGFVLLMALIAAALGSSLSVVLSILTKEDLMLYLCTMLAALTIGLLVCAVLLPLCYKLGAERARPWLMIVTLVPVMALLLGSKLGLVDLSGMESVTPGRLAGVLGVCAAAALAGLGLSCRISCRIAAGKEY